MAPSTPERTTDPPRQDLPLREALLPLKDAFEAVGEAQRRSEEAIQDAVRRLESVLEGAELPTPPPRSSIPGSEGPRVDETASVPSTSASPSPADPAPAPSPEPHPPAELTPARRPEPAQAVAVAEAEIIGSEEERPESVPVEARRQMRSRLLEIGTAMADIDRLVDAEQVLGKLWELGAERGLRLMLLQERGKSLQAERSEGFESFEGDRAGRLRKIAVAYDPDGLFAVTAKEKAPYSGPRPLQGMPVDLVLVMGKRAPVWCLVVPLPYRNRWGRFLYVDADAEHLEALLQFDPLARYAVAQLRAARYHRHQPAERVRAIRELTLQERRRRSQRRRQLEPTPQAPADDAAEELPPESFDLLEMPPGSDRFDEDGNLVRPLDGAEILSRMGDLPSMPHIASRVLSMLNNPDTKIAELQEVIATDQALSVRLLQIANSSLYGSMRDCNTISEAVMRLGFTAIRSWLLASVTRTVFLQDASRRDLRALWQQSVMTAMAAQLIAEKCGRMDPETAFVGGLLQNIGLLLLARNHPVVFAELHARCVADAVSYYVQERQMLGFDHADLGSLVLQRWGLGDSLVAAVAAHHRLELAGADGDFAAIVALAEDLALRIGGGPTETSEEDLCESEASDLLGLRGEDLDELGERLGRMILDRSLLG